MLFSKIKEISRLISKEMSNIYLKVTIEKNWHPQNFDFLSLKRSSPGQCWGNQTHTDIIEISNFLLQHKNHPGSILKRIMTF